MFLKLYDSEFVNWVDVLNLIITKEHERLFLFQFFWLLNAVHYLCLFEFGSKKVKYSNTKSTVNIEIPGGKVQLLIRN
jgi:hypothetical protein